MSFLSRDQILATRDRRRVVTVDVPEWGGKIRVRELSSRERVQVETTMVTTRHGQTVANMAGYSLLRGRVLSLSLIDEEGKLIFTEDDYQAINELGAGVVERLFEVARELSGLAQKDVQEMVGESSAIPNGASASA